MTVRWVAETDPMDWLWVLMVAGGTSRVMARISEMPFAVPLEPQKLLSLVLVAGPIAGLVLIFGVGRLLHWMLGRMGGTGTWIASRTAVTWALAPSVPSLALWAIMIAGYGVKVLSPSVIDEATDPAEVLILSLDYLVQFALMAWSLVLEIVCLAEVHRLSAWRVVLAELVLGAGVLLLALILFFLL